MRVEDSKYNNLYDKKVSLKSGNLYFFKKFIITEMNEGVHFNWEMAQDSIAEAYEHYGEDNKVAYISNRVNSYSVNAQDWLKFYQHRHHLEAIAIVAYNKVGLMNVEIEKIFNQTQLRKFNKLDDAVNWVHSVKGSTALKNNSEK